jgi:hypothetical protein
MTDPLAFAAELEQDYCTCLPAYLDRGRTDPQCVSCNMEYDRKEAAKVIRGLHAQNAALKDWIRDQSIVTDTCTWNILREKCNLCQCHRSKK